LLDTQVTLWVTIAFGGSRAGQTCGKRRGDLLAGRHLDPEKLAGRIDF
jgi:hypothetical protein